MEKQLSAGLIFFCLALTARELWNGPPSSASSPDEAIIDHHRATKSIPTSRLGSRQTTLTLNSVEILYCSSCGYRKAFDDVTQIIHTKYPDIDVRGDNYPSPMINTLLNNILGLAKMALIGLILTNTNPFVYLGMATPSYWYTATQRKMMSCMMIFFISNAIQGQLSSTGAFEISFNNIPILSKI